MSQNAEKTMIDFSIIASIFVAILTVYVMLSYLIQLKNIKYLHQSTVAIVMGVLTAVFCKYVILYPKKGLKSTIQFSNQIFFAIILPPIIFSAGFSLRKKLFFQNFGLICFYGIIGTIIGFIFITLTLVFLNFVIFKALSLSDIMIIASVLCATDTVASMTLLKAEKFPVLNSLLFGESIINDAVAIILFRAVNQFSKTKDEEFGFDIILKMALSFVYLFSLSMILGIVAGLFLSYIFRRFSFFSKHPIKETSIVLLNGYFWYLLGEIFELSGIITLFTLSIIIGHYAFMNLSEQSKKGTGLAFETVSYIAEAFIFAYLGASILSISQNWIAALMGLALMLFLPLIRAFMVYILPVFYWICKKQFYVKNKQLKVSWFAGMIRGVITFALCLQVESSNKQFVISLVLVIVLVTTVGGSSFLNKFIQLIKLQSPKVTDQLEYLNKEGLQEEKDCNGGEDSIKQDGQKKQSKRWAIVNKMIQFEKKYMQPLFGKAQNDEQIEDQAKGSVDTEVKSTKMEKNNEVNANRMRSQENHNSPAEIELSSPTKSKSKSSAEFKDWKPFQSEEKNH